MKRLFSLLMLIALFAVISACKNLPTKSKIIKPLPTESLMVIESLPTATNMVIEPSATVIEYSPVVSETKTEQSVIKEDLSGNYQSGEYVVFGSYEQDNNQANGKEPIEWLVLERQGNNMLLISRYALDCKQYHSVLKSVTWETSSLHSWLNGTFLNEAFSAEEQMIIQSTLVSADKNPTFDTNPGNSSTDKIFLQSITEAKSYFTSDSARQVEATKYAKAKGAYIGFDGYAWCWLRSPGYDSEKAAGIMTSGGVDDFGDDVYGDVCGAIRPVMWVSQ